MAMFTAAMSSNELRDMARKLAEDAGNSASRHREAERKTRGRHRRLIRSLVGINIVGGVVAISAGLGLLDPALLAALSGLVAVGVSIGHLLLDTANLRELAQRHQRAKVAYMDVSTESRHGLEAWNAAMHTEEQNAIFYNNIHQLQERYRRIQRDAPSFEEAHS